MSAPTQSEVLNVSTWLSRGAFSASQMVVLLTLLKQESATMTELSRINSTSATAMTGIVDTLEKKDFIQRIKDDRDRRKVMVMLTPPGREALRRLFEIDTETLHETFSR